MQDEDAIRSFLQEIMNKGSEPWKAMKLVLLGHGKIGKTTVLHALKSVLQPSAPQQVKQRNLNR